MIDAPTNGSMNSDSKIDTARGHLQSAQTDIGQRITTLTKEVNSLYELVDAGSKRISEPRILAWITYALSIDCVEFTRSRDGKINGIIEGINEIIEDEDLCRTMHSKTIGAIANTMNFVKSAVELLCHRQNFESLCVGLDELTKIVNTNLAASNDLKKISDAMLKIEHMTTTTIHDENESDPSQSFMPR
jgi:hypothetical protein